MTLYLVRHSPAGSRSAWDGDDTVRPLTREGRYQAAELVEWLAPCGIEEVRSSPYRRCVETVAPLAAALGLTVEVDDTLAEGEADRAVRLVRELWGHTAALSTHGDIVPAVLDALAREDGVDLGPDPKWKKGSVWILEPAAERGRFARAQYVAPPA